MKDGAYKNYMIVVLLLISAFELGDLRAFGISLQSIKLEFRLSDTQLGLLTGIAFTLFYAVMGIPLARWADRGNRVSIISLTAGLFSVMVALCGLATGFLQLLVIRIGVAVGEAGCGPTAQSLIADYFTRSERPRAMGFFLLASPLSAVIGLLAGGWLNQLYGWRATFVILALPGLILALLVRLTLREPRRSEPLRDAAPAPKANADMPASVQPSLKDVFVTLGGNATFRHLLIIASVTSFFASGIGQWQAAYFIRSFGLKTGELGTWLAVASGLGATLGLYFGGMLASRRAANNERLQLTAMAVLYCFIGLIDVGTYLSPSYHLAFGLIGLVAGAIGAIIGPLNALVQTLTPARMRATALAVLLLSQSLIGAGLGPLAAGALSDAFHRVAGKDSLRYALVALSFGYLWSAWHAWRASKTVDRDLKAVLIDHDVAGPTEVMASEPHAFAPSS